MKRLVCIALAAATPLLAQAQETTLRVVSAFDTAGCVNPRRPAAGVTPFSCSTASNTRSRLRSRSCTFMPVMNNMNDIDLTNG